MFHRRQAFTLIELMVALSVVALLVLLVARLFDQAATLTTFGLKRMNADEQSRQVFDRMTVDFAQMLKRKDVDYYLKSAANPEAGNDQIAFYAIVPGYYPSAGSQSPISLVAYRVGAKNKLERMSKGLLWSGVSTSSTPIVFLPFTISTTWPAATNSAAEPDYEVAGAQIFRFEYAYVLKDGPLSLTPWSLRAGHSAIDGMRDVGAIDICLATIDSKARQLVTDSQIATTAGDMNDFAAPMAPGQLLHQWQAAVNAEALPRPVIQGVRFYERQFDLLK
jgi:prepilin-type N-terminal cleavage/methylation domain-containing protein